MNRLIFEDDDVIREALMMDSDANDDHNLIETGPQPKENTSESVTQNTKKQDVLKTNVDKEVVTKEVEVKQDPKSKCQSCLQEFEKLELQNHDCGKKKRKSLVLSFYKNQPIASSRNIKITQKSDIKNDTAKSDRRESINSRTNEKISKDKHKKSSECDKNTSEHKSKTPIFYECSLCFNHFTKKEINVHNCRDYDFNFMDSSPCLTLKFSTSSSDSSPRLTLKSSRVDKKDKNELIKPKKSTNDDEFQFIDKKDKEEVQVKRKRDSTESLSTDLKRTIKSHYLRIKNMPKKFNQPISLETEIQKDTISEKSMKRKSSSHFEKSTEKVNEPKTKKRKQNNETNQSGDTTIEGGVDVNETVPIETQSQNLRTKNTDQSRNSYDSEKSTEKVDEPKTKRSNKTNQSVDTTIEGNVEMHSQNSTAKITDKKAASKNETSKQSITTISENKQKKVHFNEVETSANEKSFNRIEHKTILKSCAVVLNKLDELKQNVVNKRNKLKPEETIVKLESEERETNSYYDKLRSKRSNTDEKSSKNRLNKLKVPPKKDNNEAEAIQRNEQGTVTKNIINQKEAEQIVTKSQSEERKIDKKSDKILNHHQMSKRDKKSSKNLTKNVISEKYNLFRLNELKVLLEKEKESTRGNLVSLSKLNSIKKEILDNQKDENEPILQPEQRKLNENSVKLLNQVKISSHSNDKQSKMGEKSSKITKKNVIPENNKLFRFSEQKVLLRKEKSTSVKNLEKRKLERVPLEYKQDAKKSVEIISKVNENSPTIVKKNIAETYKMFRLNELKILLEKDKVVKKTSNRNMENKAPESITPRNEQDSSTENQNSNYQKEKESNHNLINVEMNEINNDSEQENAIKIESNQEDYKTNIESKKKKHSKKTSRQKKFTCRLCHAKFSNINHKHICKNKAKKTKFKKNELQMAEKSDVILKKCTNDSQSKINITILSHENVKVVTVSNNAKDYEVNHEVISNYVNYDQTSEQNEIKETSKQILPNNISTNETSIETISQSKLSNIAGDKSFENEKTTNDVTEKAEQLIKSQQSNAEEQSLDITSREFNIDNSKPQDNNTALSEESQTRNKNEKDDEIIFTDNLCNALLKSKEKGNTIGQDANHTYNITDVENSKRSVLTQDTEHSYSITKEIFQSDKIIDVTTKSTANEATITKKEIGVNETEINVAENIETGIVTIENQIAAINTNSKFFESTNNGSIMKNDDDINRAHETENNDSAITTEKHIFKNITEDFLDSDLQNVCCKSTNINHLGEVPSIVSTHSVDDEIVEIQTFPEREVATSESNITLPENIRSKVTIADKIVTEISETKSKITISESEITEPEIVESEVTVLNQNENTTSIKNVDLESEIGSIGSREDSEIVKIAVQNNRFDNNILGLEENIVSIDNVAEEIIIPELEEEIIYVESEPMSADIENHIALVPTQPEDDSFVLVENVGQEVIVTTDNIKTDDVSIENVRDETVIFSQKDDKLVLFQKADNIIESTERLHTMLMKSIDNTVINENLENAIILSTQIEGNDNNTSAQIKENIKLTCTDSPGLSNNKQHNINKKIFTKTSAGNPEYYTGNEEIAKVSVESLENEVFVPKYIGGKVLVKDKQIEANVPSTDVEASVSIECNISKQVTTDVLVKSKANVSNKAVEAQDSVKETQNETVNVGPSDSIDDTNISTTNYNLSIENMSNTFNEPLEANIDQPTENLDDGNEFVKSSDKENSILTSQSGQIENTIPTNDEIETIIVISSGEDNKKNILVTQNEKNETVIIISKRKEINSADHQGQTASKIKEITVQDHRIENVVGNQYNKISLTEKEDKNELKCSICSKLFTKDDLKSHNCTEKSSAESKIHKVAKFRFRNLNKLPKKDSNDSGEKIRVKEKEDTLNIDTQMAAISNQIETQNKIMETQELLTKHSNEAQSFDENNRKNEDNTLESQQAFILNQNESQNKIQDSQERSSNSPKTHECEETNKEKKSKNIESQLAAILNQNELQSKMTDRISSVNNHRNENNIISVKFFEKHGSPITNNQLLDILTKNEDSPQVENCNVINEDTAQTKCFRCSNEFTTKELTTHTCLESKEMITSNLKIDNTSVKLRQKMRETDKKSVEIEMLQPKQNAVTTENNILYVIDVEDNSEIKEKMTKLNYIKCFNCSEVYDKTHKCTNNKTKIENNNTSLEKPEENSKEVDTSKIKKNKYYFDAFIIKTSNGMYKCKICKKEYKARKNLVRHVHQHEKDYDKEKFKCSYCPKTFEYKSSWKAHEECHTGETYDCAICEKSFSRKTNLYTHLKVHNDEKFKCDNCEVEYSSKSNLINHPCFNTKIYSCNYCNKSYKQKQNLNDHLHSHAGVTPYTCEFCNKKIKFKGTYLRHKNNCDAAKLKGINKNPVQTKKPNRNSHLSCKICSMILKNKSELRRHEWKHENKHFKCNLCQKQFNYKHYLQLHLAKHVELGMKRRKFNCSHCNKIFCTKFGLNMHLNKHNDVKFPCPLCEKLFTTKLSLKTHERTHTCHNPFVCENCKKAFNNRSNYNSHRKSKVCFIPLVKI